MFKARFPLFAGLVLAGLVGLHACEKSDDAGSSNDTTRLTVRMTDNPVNAEKVYIDLREVRLKFDDTKADNNDDDVSDWVFLSTRAGVYNLLDYRNGLDTAVAVGTVPAGNLKEVRLVLGSNNSIVVGGQTFPLIIPSGSSSGLKVKIGRRLRNTEDLLLLDFDAALSIHQVGNGSYHLKPVIKLK
jgi:hypothetical protein